MKTFKGRKEDARLLTGRGSYTADCDFPGQLHAAFARADRAHAEIVAIERGAAAAMPGVQLVLTGEDLAEAGLRTLPSLVHYPGRGGSQLALPERSPLARGRVRFVGEPVALVLADSPALAMDAAEAIETEYRDLPALVGVEAALGIGVPAAAACFDDVLAALTRASPPGAVHESIPGNVCFDFEYGDEAKTAALFAGAAHVVRVVIDSPRVAPNPMETRAIVAAFENGRYRVRCPNQGTFLMRDSLAYMLGVDAALVRVEPVDTGGAFGARTAPCYEFAAIAQAAKRAARAVKWVSTRSEDFTNDGHGRAVRLLGELALDADGRFLALRTLWLADSGAYLSQAGALTNTGNNRTIGAGPYQVEAVYGRHLQVLTHTAPTEAYRGAGRPEAALVLERLVDEAACALGADPFELRRRNAIPREAMPWRSASGTVYDSGDYRALLDAAERASAWREFPERRAQSRLRGRLRGIGVALFVEPSGGAGVARDQVAVHFAKDGEVQLFMASGASGQGHETVFPELVASRLGLDPDRIVLRAGDPDGPALEGGAAIGSRTTLSQGSAFAIAADEVLRKGLELAAQTLEAAPADIEFRDGRYVVKGTDRGVALAALIERHRPAAGPHPLDTVGENPVSRAFPSGAYVCELELDPETGASEIAAFTAVDDVGHALNPTLVEGQVTGGVVQSAGQVFGERLVYEAGGQLLTGSFMDYPMPRADLVGGLRLLDRPVPSPHNPIGAKGAGETGTTGALPACTNAVLDALRGAGAAGLELPATPERVWAALNGR